MRSPPTAPPWPAGPTTSRSGPTAARYRPRTRRSRSPSDRALGDEHELAARAIRSVPHLQHPVAPGGQARFHLVAPAEPQRRVRRADRAVGQEGVGEAERDERKVHGGDLEAPLDQAAARDVTADRAGLGRPFLPRPASRTPGFEGQVPAPAKRGPDGPEHLVPVLIGEEDLGYVPG